MTFRVGMKVVVVWDGANADGLLPNVRLGEIYTVAAVCNEINPRSGHIGLWLVERSGREGRPYRADRFRPTVERKTDISIFKKLLTPNPELEEAR